MRVEPLTKVVPHSVVIDSAICSSCGSPVPPMRPGEARTLSTPSQCIFRVEEAKRVPGIDYEAFVIESARVGQRMQYREARPAAELLSQLRRETDFDPDSQIEYRHLVFDVCQPGLAIFLTVKNVSEKAQRFAIELTGKAVI